MTVASTEGDNLTIENKWIQLESVAMCLSKLPHSGIKKWKIPYELIIVANTKNTLHRIGHFKDPQSFIDSITPGAKEEEFYLNVVEQNGQHYISMVKNETIHEIVEPFAALKLPISNILLGYAGIPALSPTLPNTQAIVTQNHLLSIHPSSHSISAIAQHKDPNYETICLADEWVDTRLANGLASILSTLTAFPILKTPHPLLDSLDSDWSFRQKFYKTLQISIIALLALVFASLFAIQTYQSSNQSMRLRLASNQQKLIQLDSLKVQHEGLKALWGDNVRTTSSKSSFYADRLLASTPSSIQLEKVEVFPSQVKDEYQTIKGDMPTYDGQSILVNGQAKDIGHFTHWKTALADMTWVAKAHTVLLSSEPNGTVKFDLQIVIKKN